MVEEVEANFIGFLQANEIDALKMALPVWGY